NEHNHPLFNRFDLLLKNFNSASSYSGPAALRLLYGACGQMPHTQFYKNASAECLIFPELERAGFKIGGLLNHDGVYEDFTKSLEQRGGLAGKVAIGNASSERMKSFDGTPIFDDQEVLSTWWDQRLKNGDQPVALYYNTISLHDGNRLPGMTSRSSLDTYKPRLQKLFADFDKFITQLESSGRPVVLLMVPEHGASLRGDKVQISGMREIPGPRITLVPAAVKLIGLKDSPITGPVTVDKPMSYFGLYSLLGDLIADSPYVPGARPLAARLDTLQETAFVSENDDIVVMRDPKGAYVMRSGENGAWVSYAF
ncbi:MAG: cellulose biosynthesis protein BcsG, partial [Macromonas sp.]